MEVATLPTISAFFGIIIRLYDDDHEPPHFHAHYGEHSAQVTIESPGILAGSLPARALALTIEWALAHQDELPEDWRRARQHEALLPIEPLE